MMSSETKVGIFALCALVIIGFITLKIGSRSFVAAGGYEVSVVVDNAIGVRPKTPVEIAGIRVGQVKEIGLEESRKAKLTLLLNKDVNLPVDSVARIRSKGFLGEIVIEIVPGTEGVQSLADGGALNFSGQSGDINMLMTQFSSIANDIKAVSAQLRDVAGTDRNSPMWQIVNNLQTFTQTLANNQANFNKMAGNLAELTEALKGTIVKSRENVEDSLKRIASITQKVDEGKGTIGKLVNDDATVNKLNEAVDNLNSTLGNIKTIETEIGYHAEYLGHTKEFKNYVNLTIRPKPDKAFIFDFVQNTNPSPDRSTNTSTISTGGTSTTVTTNTATVNQNQFRFSAQLAKSFYDFTVRGGVIESRGGVGLDYAKGPAGLQFSAYDFQTQYDQRTHLKLAGTVNVTKNLFLIGGGDDLISQLGRRNWFMGAGIRLVDEDVKSLIGTAGGISSVKR